MSLTHVFCGARGVVVNVRLVVVNVRLNDEPSGFETEPETWVEPNKCTKSSARTMRMGGVDGCVMPNLFFFLLDFQSANTLKTPFALERPMQSTLPSH